MKAKDLGIETNVNQNKRPDRKLNKKRDANDEPTATTTKYVAPSRQGKKPIITYAPEYARTALKIFCMERGMSVDRFMLEAADEKLMNMGADFNLRGLDANEKE
ncbi:MAG: hypothetical protein HRT81_12840 [Henriciella sp.]|nr:hypothetical protein [Henriciella sp.]